MIKLARHYLKAWFQGLVKNTGFFFKLSQFKYSGMSKPGWFLLGGFIYIWYVFKKLFNIVSGKFELDYVEIFITSKCNLMCRDCSVLIPYLDKMQDFDIHEAIKDLSTLIDSIDYIYKVGILGGEAMLHKDFLKILNFACNNKKIGSIRIVTNGTFMPDESILKALESNSKIYVNISDYTKEGKDKRIQLMNVFDERNIKYILYENQEWSDLGSPIAKKKEDAKNLRKRFKRCWMTRCNGIIEGRLYMCGRAAFLPRVYKEMDFETDYLDLRSIENTADGRKKLKKAIKTNVLKSCAYCNGTFNSRTIQPAIQLNKSSSAREFAPE